MQSLTAQQLAGILGVPVAAGCPGALISGGVSTDTRTLQAGAVFFALTGESFDGGRFAGEALARGASAVVVRAWSGMQPERAAVIIVDNPLTALQRLAGWWRGQLTLPVVCITGSSGKTSTKDFAAAVLARRFNLTATKGNLNNHIGLPLTVLSATQADTAAVWELGMNHPGEIAPLCEIAKPGIGIITNIGSAHLEFMGTRRAIAEEKGMLARALPSTGTLILPANCDYHQMLCRNTRASVISVGGDNSPVRATNLRHAVGGIHFTLSIENQAPAEVGLPVAGRHMVSNALLAAAAGWKLGLSVAEIAAGLGGAVLTGGRLRCFDHHGITVIDDTYNANPESMAAAMDTLANTPVATGGRRIVVLGRMGELGDHAASAHQRTGELALTSGLTLIAVGEGAEGIAAGADNAPYFPEFEQAAAWLVREVKPGDAVLFKGSRTATIERVMHTAFPSS